MVDSGLGPATGHKGGASPSLVQALGPVRAEVGEGPHWDAESNRLWWVDLLAGLVHGNSLSNDEPSEWSLGWPVGAVVKRAAGGFVVADNEGFSYLDGQGAVVDRLRLLRPGHRMNDAKADPAGWLWSGATAMDFSAGDGAMWVLKPDGRAQQVLDGLTLPNGLGWSPDGQTFYLVDSVQGWLRAWAFAPGRGIVGPARTLVEFAGPAHPDGLCIDAEGSIWLALWGGSALERYSADGTPLGSLPLPVAQPSSCTFAGPDLGTLVITSARLGLGERAGGLDGAVLVVPRAGATGVPTARFGG